LVNTFSKEAGYKNQHTKISTFYTNHEEAEKKNQENNPSHYKFQKIKNLGVNLVREVKDLDIVN
jgi:hypothetical protein